MLYNIFHKLMIGKCINTFFFKFIIDKEHTTQIGKKAMTILKKH